MDPGLYARSFRDVYDDWYGDLDDPAALVDEFRSRLANGAHVVELGSGTGRLSAPLGAAGFVVTGIDISPAMLSSAPATTTGLCADMTALPVASGAAAAVLIAYNTLFNLTGRAAQHDCLHEVARVLQPGGTLAIEAFVAPSSSSAAFGVSTRPHPTDNAARLLIVTGPSLDDPDVITGSHIERRADSTTCRPWQVTYQSPAQLDAAAPAAGLHLVDRHENWNGAAFTRDSARHVSFYQRGERS